MKKSIKYLVMGVVLVISFLIPLFLKTPYLLQIAIFTFYMASASLAWSILGGLTGQLSLGHATFLAFGAYISTLLLVNFNLSPWIAIPIVFVVVGLISVIIFYPCFILKGPYFTLVTIALGETFRNLFTNWDLVGKGQGIVLQYGEDSFWLMRFRSKVPYYYIALVMLILIYIFIIKLDKSRLGFAFKTIREDEDTAKAIGINPTKYKLIATIFSAGIMAIIGVYYANYFRFIDPDIMMQTYSVEYIVPVVIGGLNFVSGPLLGAIVLTPLSEYLRSNLSNVIPGANLIVYSLILIFFIKYEPKGILGFIQDRKLRKKQNNSRSLVDNTSDNMTMK